MAALRNPSAEVLIGEIGLSIAKFHKAETKRLLAKHELKKPETFYWKGVRGLARKASSVDAVPDNTLSRPPATIAFIDANKGTVIAEVAVAAVSMFRRAAPVRTGLYAGSLEIELNGKPAALTSIVKYATSNPYSEYETITIYPRAEYAAKLEADYYRRDNAGVIFKIANSLIAQFGSRASVQFLYVNGAKYALPAIRIGAPGAFPSGIKRSRPGRNMRRLKRRNNAFGAHVKAFRRRRK